MYKKLFFLSICLLALEITVEAKPEYSKLNFKKITIFWDTSLSMIDKDVNKELELLDAYFLNTPNIEVELITFSNSIDLQKTFVIVDSNWITLKEELLNINYDGVAFFDVLNRREQSDLNLLFTDGFEILDKLILNNSTPTFIITSTDRGNFNSLKRQSIQSKGNFINLSKVSIKQGLSLLNLMDVKIISLKLNKIPVKKPIKTEVLTNINLVSGTVYSSEGVLFGATIAVNGGVKGVVTDDKGKFTIKATQGDVLVISYLGKFTKKIEVDEFQNIEVILLSGENELDEVIVNAKNKKEVVNAGFSKKEKRKVGYDVKSISGSEIAEGRVDNLSVHGKFSGVTAYGQNDDISQMVLRANSMLLNVFPLVVLDGSPLSRSSSVGRINLSNFIDPNTIADITVLKGLAATNKWGSEGANGVILITSKSAFSGQKKGKKPYNKALLRNNNFTENLSLVNTSINEKYIKELKELKTINEIYNHYLKQRINYLDNPMYFGNIADYISQWGNKELSSKILSNILEINSEDIGILKFVAYKAEQQRNFLLAKKIYEKIAKLKPREAQSYRDLALIYQETGYYQEAFNIYKKIKDNRYSGINFSGVQKNIDNEMKHLLLLHKNELDISGVAKQQYLNIKNVDYDARIVFDWNDRAVDFELQFVNPQKKFFTWSHTKSKNAIRLYEEEEQGFNTEEFLLIDAEKGEWQINIESRVKKRKTPVVLKYTVYRNYGKVNEIKESKLLILNNIKEKQMAGKIVI